MSSFQPVRFAEITTFMASISQAVGLTALNCAVVLLLVRRTHLYFHCQIKPTVGDIILHNYKCSDKTIQYHRSLRL